MPSEGDTKIPAVIVLISDGKDQGQEPPGSEKAVERANKAKVSVFTIAYGTPNGVVEIDDGSGSTQLVPVPVDEPALAEVAKRNGRPFAATRPAGELEQVYDRLRQRRRLRHRTAGSHLEVGGEHSSRW